MFSMHTESKNQFRVYASEKTLNVISVFETSIRIKRNPEIITPFYFIENGKQSLLRRETAIKYVIKLGLSVNRLDTTKPFPKWKDVVKLSIEPKVVPIQHPVRRLSVEAKKSRNS